MEDSKVPDSERPTSDRDDEKLIAEWGVSADDQILWAGLAVVAALALLFSWQTFFSGDDADSESVAAQVAEQLPDGPELEGIDGGQIATGLGSGAAVAVLDEDSGDQSTGEVTQEPIEEPTDEVEVVEAPEPVVVPVDEAGLESALGGLDGDVAASLAESDDATGNTVTLTGFVANEQEAAGAVAAAGAVEGVDAVVDDLDRLEPVVSQVLADAGVIEPLVAGEGTTVVVAGTVQSENERTETLGAAAAVPGVTAVVDQLQVSVAQSLNELPTIPFATNSDQILAGGQDIVSEAAEIITTAGDVQFQVQGYTDTVGDAASNLELSSARAEAVTQALIAAGVDANSLTAQGFGETEQFGEGTSPEALAANRIVRFEQIG